MIHLHFPESCQLRFGSDDQIQSSHNGHCLQRSTHALSHCDSLLVVCYVLQAWLIANAEMHSPGVLCFRPSAA